MEPEKSKSRLTVEENPSSQVPLSSQSQSHSSQTLPDNAILSEFKEAYSSSLDSVEVASFSQLINLLKEFQQKNGYIERFKN